MSQASDVEALLLRFLESEGTRLPCPTAAQHPPPETPDLAACPTSTRADADPAATPWPSQRSACEGSADRGGASAVVTGLLVTRAPSVESDTQSAAPAAALSASPRRRRSTTATPHHMPGRISSGSVSSSSSCPSNDSISAAGITGAARGNEYSEPPLRAPSASPSSSQVVLSLSHPVVEFLAGVQLQGYAAHLVEDLGIRSMPALLSAAATEADVQRLLGPYASLQQQAELWRGLRRWEKETARLAKAAAEEQRRREINEAREQRRLQQAQAKKKTKKCARKETQAAASASRVGGVQLSMALFTQLEQEDCVTLPSLSDRRTTAKGLFSALDPFTVSSEAVSTAGGSEPLPPPHDTRVAPSYASSLSTSCVSLTTSATQLMRELSYRRTRSRRDANGGDARGREVAETATQSVTIDVDAEEVEETEGEGDQQVEQQQQQGAKEALCEVEVDAAAPTASQQSWESHLSSLLCSLQASHEEHEHREGEEDEEREGGGHSDCGANLVQDMCVAHSCSDCNTEWTRSGGEWQQSASSSPQWQQQQQLTAASTESLSGASDRTAAAASGAAGRVRNTLVASRHVSLSALSAHAELKQLPPRPLRVPSATAANPVDTPAVPSTAGAISRSTLSSAATLCVEDVGAVCGGAEEDEEGDARAIPVDVMPTATATPASATPAAATATTAIAGATDRLTAARARLEECLRAALHRYNEEIAAVIGEDEERQSAVKAAGNGDLWLSPVGALLQPLRCFSHSGGIGLAKGSGDALVRWTALPPLTSQPPAEATPKCDNAPLPPQFSGNSTASQHDEEVRSNTQRSTLPPLSAAHTAEPCASPSQTPLMEEVSCFTLSALPPPPSSVSTGRPTAIPPTPASLDSATASARSTAGVMLSSLTSADVSTTTTARPTVLPDTDDAPQPTREDACGQTQRRTSPYEESNDAIPVEWNGSRSVSMAALTAASQLPRLHVSNYEDLERIASPLPQRAPSHLYGCEQRRDGDGQDGRVGDSGGEEEGEQGGEDDRDEERVTVSCVAVSEEPLWVEEPYDDAGLTAARVRERSSSSLAPSLEPLIAPLPPPHHESGRTVEEARQRSPSNSQEWWDSYGIGALDYTQNNMDLLPAASQGGASGEQGCHHQSPRGASPGVKTCYAAWNGTTSPPPREVVEVTSSDDDMDGEAKEGDDVEWVAATREGPLERSRTPPAGREAWQCPPLSPTTTDTAVAGGGVTPGPSEQSRSHAHVDNSSAAFAVDEVDPRLQPAVWCRMTNTELRALCAAYGLAVRPTPTTTATGAAARSPPPSASTPPFPPRGADHADGAPSPVRSPPYSPLGRAAVVGGAAAHAPQHTSRTLFDNSTSSLFSPRLRAPSAPDATDRAAQPESAVSPSCFADKRVLRMEREALLAALQLLHVRLRFRRRVAPFHLHRVAHMSGLPYKRVRAADLLDEAAVLTRDDLQQARQRYKAEEQAEVERCVLAALVADAAESVEQYAQHVATAAAVAGDGSEERVGDASQAEGSVNSSSIGSPHSPQMRAAAAGASSCYEQLLLREPVSTEAVTVAVQRCFPHVAHTRVQQLLTLNEVIAEAVLVASPQRSVSRSPPPPLPPAASPQSPGDAIGSPASPPTAYSPSQNGSLTQGQMALSQEAARRANTRRYFAQRGYMARGGTWRGRGGFRGRGGGR